MKRIIEINSIVIRCQHAFIVLCFQFLDLSVVLQLCSFLDLCLVCPSFTVLCLAFLSCCLASCDYRLFTVSCYPYQKSRLQLNRFIGNLDSFCLIFINQLIHNIIYLNLQYSSRILFYLSLSNANIKLLFNLLVSKLKS